MEVETIQMPKEIAEQEYKKYLKFVKERQDKRIDEMKRCLYEMKKGCKLIDIHKVMEHAGLNKNWQPKLAIARADWKQVFFVKQDEGRGYFSPRSDNTWQKDEYDNEKIEINKNTFMEWKREVGKDGKATWQIEKKAIKTKVPLIPVDLIPEGNLDNYFILWEVMQWEDLPQTKDPLLLKRISENMFAILGAWDITPLEQAILDK